MLQRYQHRRGATRQFAPTHLNPLDRALPHGGLPVGAVTEIFSAAPGTGASTLAYRIARAVAGPSRAILVVDTRGDFYPPAAWQLGLAPRQLLVVRARQARSVLWALNQALRCPAVAAVLADVDCLTDADSRRLQLAAEAGRTVGLLLRPSPNSRRSFAAVQMLVEPVPTDDGSNVPLSGTKKRTNAQLRRSRVCRLTLTKVREGMPASPVMVDLNHETGHVPVLPEPRHRPAASRDRRLSA
ncbi:MAG: ImuA family protein [Phycisphaerae bacterium]